MSNYEQMQEWYTEGNLPWDDVLPPPEIIATVDALAAGRALDIGCGYGRASIYLAQHGWQVDGVDFIETAIVEAQKRAAAAGVTANFYQGDVTALTFLEPAYQLAIDVGCSHALDEAQLQLFAAGLGRLLAPAATFIQYVRLRSAESDKGVAESLLRTTFGADFTLTKIEHGKFSSDEGEWKSAWIWWERNQA